MSANAPANVRTRVADDNYKVDFYFPAIMDALSTVLVSGNAAGVDARTFYNWFYYMTIQKFQNFLPAPAASSKKLTFEEMLEKHRRSVERREDAALEKILKRQKVNGTNLVFVGVARQEFQQELAVLLEQGSQMEFPERGGGALLGGG